MTGDLLARYADAAFWLGRYVERAENLARILDVQDTFSRDSRGSADWPALLRLYADEERFRAAGRTPDATGIVHFYLTDATNPTSIRASLYMARENARTLRPMLSTEVWTHLNTFHNEVRRLERRPDEGLYRTCSRIKEQCQTHAGVVEATVYRDEVWFFHQIGVHLERAAQTTHYLDVRYRDLLPRDDGAARGEADERDLAEARTRWIALLRSQAALHGFRRVHRGPITAERVAGFLLFDPRFPRAVRRCIRTVDRLLRELRADFALTRGEGAQRCADSLRLRFGEKTIEEVVRGDLHAYLDRTQLELYGLSERLREEFFV